MWMALVVTILAATPLFAGAQDREFIPRCGDCWCINDPQGTGEACPEFSEGFNDDYPDSFHQSFETFNLTSDPILVQTADGSRDCYPFADTVDPQEGYPLSNQPACAIPESGDSTVCAFKYASEVTGDAECCGREYELVTYNSTQEAEADGAMLTHSGACGVCSNAADWAVRIKYTETIEEALTLCAVSYTLSASSADRFDKLVSCHLKLGFTDECALLWSHYAATNIALCAQKCSPTFDEGDVELNGDPPQCALSECLACSNNTFQAAFDALGGRTMAGSGLTESIARPCSEFTSVVHEPCGGFYCLQNTQPPSGGFAFKVYLSLVAGFVTMKLFL